MPSAPCWSRPGTELGGCLVDKGMPVAVRWQLPSGCFCTGSKQVPPAGQSHAHASSPAFSSGIKRKPCAALAPPYLTCRSACGPGMSKLEAQPRTYPTLTLLHRRRPSYAACRCSTRRSATRAAWPS